MIYLVFVTSWIVDGFLGLSLLGFGEQGKTKFVGILIGVTLLVNLCGVVVLFLREVDKGGR